MTESYHRLVPRPLVIKQFFDIFGNIDQHDHLRQGSLRMEEVWKTLTWWHRIFATMLAVIFTDCWLAYKYNEARHNREVKKFEDFLAKLAYQLIFNDYLLEVNERRRQAVIDHDDNVYLFIYIY